MGFFTALVLIAIAGTAHAAFPGQNGRIAFHSNVDGDYEIYTVNPDGSDLVQLTNNSGVADSSPEWSPDGTRIAFARSMTAGSNGLFVMNSDGSDQHQVGPFGAPSWSPDGTKLAIQGIRIIDVSSGAITEVPAPPNTGAPDWSPDGRTFLFVRQDPNPPHPTLAGSRIWAMDVDGTNARPLTFDYGDPFDFGTRNDGSPSWSPDGSRFVFTRVEEGDGCPSCWGEVIGTLAGGEQWFDTESVSSHPDWSPDGTRLVRAAFDEWIESVPLTGTGYKIVAGPGPSEQIYGGPDWQPLPVNTPSTYVRPKGANLTQVSLVPAFKPCATPNREHGPPLAFGSCAPPQPGSSNLTVGVGDGNAALSRSTGFVRFKLDLGPPGDPDDTDVRVRFNLTNVMKASDLSEYTGELRASVGIRLTDKQSGVSSTTQAFPVEWDIPCVGTAATLDKSVCDLATTLDSIIPGAAPEGTRAIWALDQVKVFDGGPDGDGATKADNSPFAVQGVFAP